MLNQLLKLLRKGQKVESSSASHAITFTVYRVKRPDGLEGFVDVVAVLPPEVVSKGGLASEAIVGSWTELVAEGEHGEHLDPATFRPNKAFVDLLHDVVVTTAPESPELQAAAREQKTGWLYILDARTPTPDGDVPLRDIVGAFEIREGTMVPSSYWANRDFLLLSSDGFFQLSSTSLREALMKRLGEAAANQG